MSLGTSNRDGGRTSESGHLRAIQKGVVGEVLSGFGVSQRGAGANMSVDIAIGDAVIPRSDNTYGHPAFNDAILNIAVTAADVSNPRRDIAVLYVDYAQAPSTGVSNNTNGVIKAIIVPGTPAGSPADPSDAAIQSAVGASNPYIKLGRIRVAAGASTITNSVIDDLRTMAQSLANGGWNSLSSAWDSWQYSAWDSTYKLATITVPSSAIFTVGQKVRYWQLTGGWKYGFIVELTNATTIKVYQGTDYTLNNERIYLPAYSRDKAPDGFNTDPTKWTVQFTDAVQRDQNSPVNATWYNTGTSKIDLPIGVWNTYYELCAETARNSGGGCDIETTLSTTNNSETDKELTCWNFINLAGATNSNNVHFNSRRKCIVQTANGARYLLGRTLNSSMTKFSFRGNDATTKIVATIAYL